MDNAERPIIIKKVVKGGHAHHGGAWKVAYADFVTAMMAFFLLLWLLNVATSEQKSGIADYFSPASISLCPKNQSISLFESIRCVSILALHSMAAVIRFHQLTDAE